MKLRLLLALTPIALLWVRQVRFERRLSRRQGSFEREAARNVTNVIQDGAKAWKRWGDELVRQLDGALRR